MRDQVFISYSHRDGRWLERLQIYLAPLERRGRIRRWDDTFITPGQQWEREIGAALERMVACGSTPSCRTAIQPALPVTDALAHGASATDRLISGGSGRWSAASRSARY